MNLTDDQKDRLTDYLIKILGPYMGRKLTPDIVSMVVETILKQNLDLKSICDE